MPKWLETSQMWQNDIQAEDKLCRDSHSPLLYMAISVEWNAPYGRINSIIDPNPEILNLIQLLLA